MDFPLPNGSRPFSDFEEEKDLEEDPEPENLPLKESVRSKTNAARILDRHRIDYDILEYEVDPDDLAAGKHCR